MPRVELRFRNLTVSTEVHVGRRALPKLVNYVHNVGEVNLFGKSLFHYPHETYLFCFYMFKLSFNFKF